MNLEQIVQRIPEAKRILDLSWRNAQKDGVGRKYGELSVKELESFTKAILRHSKQSPERVSVDAVVSLPEYVVEEIEILCNMVIDSTDINPIEANSAKSILKNLKKAN